MDISIRRVSESIIEMKVESNGVHVVEDICNLFGFVDEQFIESLREIADELELHNENLKDEV